MRWALVGLVALGACRTRPLVLDGPQASLLGCSDGTREGFVDFARYPRIAACGGGFQVPGVLSPSVACARNAGNDSDNPLGLGCSVEDLCGDGWHLCKSSAEVAASSPDGCAGVDSVANSFFITGQSSTGCLVCATGANLANPPCNGITCAMGCAQTDATANDVFGCGSIGSTLLDVCAPLSRSGNQHCEMLSADWFCGADPDPGYTEAKQVIHTSAVGGAVCCAD
jgi:hypothetical protein